MFYDGKNFKKLKSKIYFKTKGKKFKYIAVIGNPMPFDALFGNPQTILTNMVKKFTDLQNQTLIFNHK